MCFAPQRRALFISHLARRFSEPTLRPFGASNHWKNTVFRDFPTFSRICIFFLLTLSLLLFSLLIFLFSLPLPCSAFHLSTLSEVWLLNFLRQDHTSMNVCPPATFIDPWTFILPAMQPEGQTWFEDGCPGRSCSYKWWRPCLETPHPLPRSCEAGTTGMGDEDLRHQWIPWLSKVEF